MAVCIAKHVSGYLLQSVVRLPQPRALVFDFFADARNLELLTPASLHFRILTPEPIGMARGTRIDYRLRMRGVPVRWQSEISTWDPPHAFVDEQRRGPFRLWRHQHFLQKVPEGVENRDAVQYRLPGGPIGILVHTLFVRRKLEAIFDFRHIACCQIFGV